MAIVHVAGIDPENCILFYFLHYSIEKAQRKKGMDKWSNNDGRTKMILNVQLSQTLVKNEGPMDTFRRTIPAEALQKEWSEIQAAQANPALFRPLYDRHFEPIFQFIYNRTLDEGLSADICSQVFLKAMQRLGTYSFRGVPFSAWLFRIAHNQVVDYLRRKTKRATAPLDESLVAGDYDPQQIAEKRLDIERLVAATGKLTLAQKEVISLRFAGELSVAQVAKIMGKSEGAVKALQHSAIVALRKSFSVA